jgi:predicted GIY-YIG superfamily endonuclease
MNYTYILKSLKKNWYYVGSCRNLKQRFKEHEKGLVASTKPHRPIALVYYEAYNTYFLARKREIELKKKRVEKEKIVKFINSQQ